MTLNNIHVHVAMPLDFSTMKLGKLKEFNIDASKLHTSDIDIEIDNDFLGIGGAFIKLFMKGAEFFAKGLIVDKVEGEIRNMVNSELAGKDITKLGLTGTKNKKCGTRYKSRCPLNLQCQGYMGTSQMVLSGYCQKEKELGACAVKCRQENRMKSTLHL